MDPTATVATFQYFQRHRFIMDYMYLSAAAVLIYDYLLTLPLEIKFIWFSRWGYTKALFLLVRYMPFLDVAFVLLSQLSFKISPKTCGVIYPASLWLVFIKLSLAESILAIRTWAVWRRDKMIGIILALLSLANLAAQCFTTTRFIRSVNYSPPPYPGFRGCYITTTLKIIWANYVSLTIVEAIVLVLMAISAVRSYRMGWTSELSHVVHRDGIMFYIYLLCISVTNVATMMTVPYEFKLTPLLFPLEDVLYSVFASRIILTIRDVGNRNVMETELHTSYHESCPVPVDMTIPPALHENAEDCSRPSSRPKCADEEDNQLNSLSRDY